MDIHSLIDKIVRAAFDKGVAQEKMRRYRYGSLNWKWADEEYEEISQKLVDLIELSRNLPPSDE